MDDNEKHMARLAEFQRAGSYNAATVRMETDKMRMPHSPGCSRSEPGPCCTGATAEEIDRGAREGEQVYKPVHQRVQEVTREQREETKLREAVKAVYSEDPKNAVEATMRMTPRHRALADLSHVLMDERLKGRHVDGPGAEKSVLSPPANWPYRYGHPGFDKEMAGEVQKLAAEKKPLADFQSLSSSGEGPCLEPISEQMGGGSMCGLLGCSKDHHVDREGIGGKEQGFAQCRNPYHHPMCTCLDKTQAAYEVDRALEEKLMAEGRRKV